MVKKNVKTKSFKYSSCSSVRTLKHVEKHSTCMKSLKYLNKNSTQTKKIMHVSDDKWWIKINTTINIHRSRRGGMTGRSRDTLCWCPLQPCAFTKLRGLQQKAGNKYQLYEHGICISYTNMEYVSVSRT